MTKIGLVSYGKAGNIYSVRKALIASGADVVLISKPQEFQNIEKIVLPGVGSFAEGMHALCADGLDKAVTDFSGEILGICMGMQILSYVGFEHGRTKGLNLIDGEVKRIECVGKVPHVGFNKLEISGNFPIFNGIENEWFYFMHSYELVNYTDIIALTNYENHKFVSAVESKNCVGVQFHPEKSGEAGIQLFRNFINK